MNPKRGSLVILHLSFRGRMLSDFGILLFGEAKKGTVGPRRSGGLGTPLDRLSLPGPDGDGDDECTVF